ncbi:hypothetical protein [Paramicrobacterium agarici]|uniref:hypothetical protein n=1 Tax=Paramicrobacterium agarici TaxID=630514 RepID=UPI0011533946|nr:hypothetical protein [Microbacterium agarici]TQO24259.1 hypothetical protein FB385_3139 [Microbacterium agarici]
MNTTLPSPIDYISAEGIPEATMLIIERDFSFENGRITIYPQPASATTPALNVHYLTDRTRTALGPFAHRVVVMPELDRFYGLPCVRVTPTSHSDGLVDKLVAQLLHGFAPSFPEEPRFADVRIGAPNRLQVGVLAEGVMPMERNSGA